MKHTCDFNAGNIITHRYINGRHVLFIFLFVVFFRLPQITSQGPNYTQMNTFIMQKEL